MWDLTYALTEKIGDPDLFVGRRSEMARLMNWAAGTKRRISKSMGILSRRKKGKTALLQRFFNVLYTRGDPQLIPFYYRIPVPPWPSGGNNNSDRHRPRNHRRRTIVKTLSTQEKRRIGLLTLLLLVAGTWSVAAQAEGTHAEIITLDGKNLTIENLVKVAQRRTPVQIDPAALERVKDSFKLIMMAAEADHPIYGLTRGVGENKDKPVKLIENGKITDEGRARSEQFNRNVLHSHGAGVGPELPEDVVRAIMVARLNTLLLGQSACQPEVVFMYQELLNRGIHPVLPGRGSVGQADITILPHVGLVMMGEWKVNFNGRRMVAADALREAGITPIVPFGKDALAIISSNAFSAGMGALLLHETEQLLKAADAIFALSLEGLNGNVAPLLETVQSVRPYKFQNLTAKRIRGHLAGSFLWEADPTRELQDPLSFRCASQVHAAAHGTLDWLKGLITTQLNSSDDNPAVILGAVPKPEERRVSWSTSEPGGLTGMVVPTGNFDPTAWALGFQTVGVALGHVSRSSTYRMLKLGANRFTHLSRFLAPDDDSIAFSTIEKTYTVLDAEIHALAAPVSLNYLGVAGGIEDHTSNAPLIVQRVSKIVDNLRYILGMELMYAAQAIDLRLGKGEAPADSRVKLGEDTGKVYDAFRETVPFMDKDRLLTLDIQKAYEFVRFDRVTGAMQSERSRATTVEIP